MLILVNILIVILFTIVYAWSSYNLLILIVGVRNQLAVKKKQNNDEAGTGYKPSFSIVIPVKNEAKLIGRLFKAVLEFRYPREKYEVLFVEDGSKDDTLNVCKRFAKSHSNVKILQKPTSNGKPSALNYGVQQSSGEIIMVLDADSVPNQDALVKAARYFEDSKVAAVQGRTLSINSEENMITQFISFEEAVWCEAFLRGKDALSLFVHLKGSCQFIRRDILNQLSGFDENALTEDMEFSARLAKNNYTIKYAGDICSWQESPSDLKTLFGQRTRWFRGAMNVAFKYGLLMRKMNRRNLDAELMLLGPFILIASLFSYFMAFDIFLADFPFNLILNAFNYFSLIPATITFLLLGVALIHNSKPKSLKNLLWLPFVFFYWCIQTFIAFYAALLILFGRPQHWLRTEKKGVIANPAFETIL